MRTLVDTTISPSRGSFAARRRAEQRARRWVLRELDRIQRRRAASMADSGAHPLADEGHMLDASARYHA